MIANLLRLIDVNGGGLGLKMGQEFYTLAGNCAEKPQVGTDVKVGR